MNTRQMMLNVLGYREDDEVVALALEMDLRGYGATFDEAMADLEDQVRMQLGFALFKHGSLDMAYYPAEPVWFELFAEARHAALRSLTHDDSANFQPGGLPMPAPGVIESMKEKFVAQHA